MLVKAFVRASKLPGTRPTSLGVAGRVRPRTLLSLDDHTCYGMLRKWSMSRDPVLSDLSRRLLQRDLFKAVLVDDPVRGVANSIRSKAVVRAFEKRRLNMDYYLVFDDPVPAGYRPYNAANSSDKRAAIDHIMAVNRRGELEEISGVSVLVEATTNMAGESRIFCPDSVVEVVQHTLRGGASA